MSLKLSDKWLWDFWLVQHGPDYHLFYLQAPRALDDQELRHWHTTIGHAVSTDLRRWEILPDALHPSPTEGWDDYTTWTGSVIRYAGLWHMFYTGSCRAEKGLIQRIGLATSLDLIHWTKYRANPVILLDPTWYETLEAELWHDQGWRDPWLFQHPDTGQFHALITARINTGPSYGRGVIAQAVSSDLTRWETLPPLTKPGEFGIMEVPQLLYIQGRYYLLFSTSAELHSRRRQKRPQAEPVTGTHYLVSDSPTGPFHYLTDQFLVGDPTGTFYSGKLTTGPDGGWYFLAFRNFDTKGQFVGELSDPIPVTVDERGRLRVLFPAE